MKTRLTVAAILMALTLAILSPTQAGAPDIIVGLTAVGTSPTTGTVSFTTTAYHRGWAYVEATAGPTRGIVYVMSDLGGTTHSFTFTGLLPSTPYRVTAVATNNWYADVVDTEVTRFQTPGLPRRR